MRETWRPRPSQQGMLAFAAERRSCAWWATMGAGKTSTALAWAARAHAEGQLDRLLIVAPPIVASDVWPREAARWAHSVPIGPVRVLGAQDLGLERSWDVLDGPGGLKLADWRATRRMIAGLSERVHTVPWHMLPLFVKAAGPELARYTHVVLDESTFVSEHSSQRWKAARFMTSRQGAGAGGLLELTGLPAPNGYEKLWAQAYLLDGGMRLGRTLTAFRESWMQPDSKNPRTGQVYRWAPRPDRRAALDSLLAELAISVHVDLGISVQPVDHRLIVPADARDAYDNVDRDFVHLFESGAVVSVANAAVKVGKLLQAAQGAVYDDTRQVQWLHDVKLDRLEEILDSSTGGVLLAYPFIHDWDRIRRRFKVARHIEDPTSRRRFEKGECKLLCLHPASGAHGVDGLQLGGSTIVWFGLTYNYEHYAQFNARLIRPGQRETVMLHRLIMAGTIEEYVADVVLPAKCAEDEALRLAVQWKGAPCVL